MKNELIEQIAEQIREIIRTERHFQDEIINLEAARRELVKLVEKLKKEKG